MLESLRHGTGRPLKQRGFGRMKSDAMSHSLSRILTFSVLRTLVHTLLADVRYLWLMLPWERHMGVDEKSRRTLPATFLRDTS